MSQFTEIPNEYFEVEHIKMNADNKLCENFAEPFDSFISGFCMNINGYSGSGKSNLLQNLFKMKNKKGKKCSFKCCFHRIFYVCPSQESVEKNVFSSLPDEYKFTKLNDFLINYIEILKNDDDDNKGKVVDNCEHEKKRDKLTNPPKKKKHKEVLVIMDDVGTEIRLGENEKLFNKMVANRRHNHVSIINITQRMMQIPPSIRGNLSHLISFKPKSIQEEDIIFDFTKLPKKELRSFFNFIFKEKHDFLLIDMSLIKANDFRLFRRFSEVTID